MHWQPPRLARASPDPESHSICPYIFTASKVRIYKRPAPGYLSDYLPSPAGDVRSDTIVPRRTMVIHCSEILQLEGGSAYASEGMIHISMNQRLPVVAVYVSQAWDPSTLEPITSGGTQVHMQEYQPLEAP